MVVVTKQSCGVHRPLLRKLAVDTTAHPPPLALAAAALVAVVVVHRLYRPTLQVRASSLLLPAVQDFRFHNFHSRIDHLLLLWQMLVPEQSLPPVLVRAVVVVVEAVA